MGNPNVPVSDPAVEMYDKTVKYLGGTDGGRISAIGIWAQGDIKGTEFLKDAALMGKNI